MIVRSVGACLAALGAIVCVAGAIGSDYGLSEKLLLGVAAAMLLWLAIGIIAYRWLAMQQRVLTLLTLAVLGTFALLYAGAALNIEPWIFIGNNVFDVLLAAFILWLYLILIRVVRRYGSPSV
jgi:hypothetical protein